jgi:hypothetical protein
MALPGIFRARIKNPDHSLRLAAAGAGTEKRQRALCVRADLISTGRPATSFKSSTTEFWVVGQQKWGHRIKAHSRKRGER